MKRALGGVLAVFVTACGGGGGGGSDPPTPPSAPTVTLTSSAPEVAPGASAVLTWSSTNATSCTASGGWSGSRPTSGTETVTPASSFVNYQLECTGAGGTASANVSISHIPPPEISLTGNPGGIQYSTPATLTWSTSRATACTASGGWTGTRATSGTETTGALLTTTVFTLTCTGEGGTNAVSVTISVPSPALPNVALSAMPNPIVIGSASTLSWSAHNTSDCVASGGWSGTRPATPPSAGESTGTLTSTTTYVLTCTNPLGSGQATVTVNVVATLPPTLTIAAQPSFLTAGSAATLTWSTTDATSCTASGGWSGARPPSGSASTGPVNISTSYALTCDGPGGSVTRSAGVTVTGPNNIPIANAGPDQTTLAGGPIALSGAGSSDAGGRLAGYAWTQTAGPAVVLAGASTVAPTFTAPAVATPTPLVFSLVVTDDAGATSAPDTVTVTVNPVPANTVPLTGTLTSMRVPATTNGLGFANQRAEPARGITVIALDATTQAELARGTTDASGGYALAVPPSTSVVVRAVAELVRSGAAPTWNVVVRDGSSPTYTFDATAVASGSAGAHADITIPSGWNTDGSAAGTRAAAPFAILDTIYRAQALILGAQPNANFAPLVIDWSPSNLAVDSSYYSSGTGGPTITLAGEANVDTDEYDEHVIAHEFGHYVEDMFSRSDSIGGPHAVGDHLDPRVAFGEGFGYAFAAMALDDPLSIDTFGQGQAGQFNIESPSMSVVGWYSEPSVWGLLWDLFDNAQDFIPGGSGDTLALGFAPLWSVLTGPQVVTPALTSIFPFVTALKAANPGNAASIDAIVGSYGITSATIDAFGTTETNAAYSADVLPIYTPLGIDGGTVMVRSIGGARPAFGTPNKLSNHRFLRFDVTAARSVRVRVETQPGRDPDFVLFREGIEVDRGESTGGEDLVVQLPEAGTYVLDVYDCDNAGCGGNLSSPSIVDVNVTLTSN